LLCSVASFAQSGSTARRLGRAVVKAPVQFLRSFSSDSDAVGTRTPCQHLRDIIKPSASGTSITGELPTVCDQVLDIVAGKANVLPPEVTTPIHGAKVAVDSNQRVLITEPSTHTVHILDFKNQRYSRIDGSKGNHMSQPYAIATDAANNIYVTDLDHGRIAVYSAEGKFLHYIGNFKGQEGLFQSPQAISIDRATNRIYLADSERDFVLILNTNGKILAQLGKRGGGNGPAEFKRPTDVAIFGNNLFVLDKLNNQIQVLDLDGHFRREFNLEGSGAGEGKAMAFDSQGRLFVSVMSWVEVFDQQGKLLFRFGQGGDNPGEFQLAEGICTDQQDRAYIVDSGNRRVQVFQVSGHSDAQAEAAR
jgi:DNA-binding beta-propeller fold protein YncE